MEAGVKCRPDGPVGSYTDFTYLTIHINGSLWYIFPGEKAVRECIAQGRKFADACQGQPDKGRIRKVCDDLDQLMGDLAQLRKLGKVSSCCGGTFGGSKSSLHLPSME